MSSCTPPCQSEKNEKQQEPSENQEESQQSIGEEEEGVKLLQQEPRRSSELELLDDHTSEATDTAVLDTTGKPQDVLSEELTESSQINNQSPAFGTHKLVDPAKNLQEHPDKVTIAVLGKNPEFNNIVENAILRDGNDSDKTLNDLVALDNNPFRIITTHDFFDDEFLYQDQQMTDFMANCSSGVNLFIVAVDSENAQMDNAVSQIHTLVDIFGETVTGHLVVVFEKYKSYTSLSSQLKEKFNTELGTLSEHLADDCKKWCSSRPVFKYNKNYVEEVQKRRNDLKRKRNEDVRERAGETKSSTSGPEFNVVLLGKTGTGKSASGNTILTARKPELNPSQLFVSRPSSTPVTYKCKVKEVNVFGRKVRVVDTPDFFNDDLNSQTQVEECKKYCQPGRCVVLLVIQMGRFTDGERGILERLENKFGWKIRENTIVLLTHGENAKGQEESFIADRSYLHSMVQNCGNRSHVFKNTSRNPEQVKELLKKIPDYKTIFPEFTEKSSCYMS